MATLLVPGALRTETDGAARLELAATGTLGEVLDEVTARWPRLARRIRDEHGELRRYINVYVDGEDCRALAGLQTPVSTGSEVQVLPSVAGGSISEREISERGVDRHGADDRDVAGQAGEVATLDGDAILAASFAPWVLELGLTVEETGTDWARLRLPWSPLAREGGALCGQALMAAVAGGALVAAATSVYALL